MPMFGGASTTPAAGGSLFGGGQNQGGGLFGNAAAGGANTTPFKSQPLQKSTSSVNLFGNNPSTPNKSFFPAPAGQQPAGGSLFGQPAQQQTQVSPFGALTTSPSKQGTFGTPALGQGLTQTAQNQPAAGGLFGGQPAQLGGGSLFQQTTSASKSLFGGPTTGQQQQQPGGLFSQNTQQQPAGGSLFGGQPTFGGGSLFGGQQQQQQQQPQQQQQALEDQFFQIKDNYQAVSLFKSMQQLQFNQSIKLKLSQDNVEKRKKVSQFGQAEKDVINDIQKRIDNQQKINANIKQGNAALKAQVTTIKDKINESMKDLDRHNQSQFSTKLALSHISSEVQKIKTYREQLAEAIYLYNQGGAAQSSHIPLQFFQKLNEEHQRILEILQAKIKETEDLASIVFKEEEDEKEQVPMKNKIYEICQMVYQQQKAVGFQMLKIDEKVQDLKRQFTNLLYQRNPYITPDEVEGIFKRFDNFEINKALQDMQKKHESVQLAQKLTSQMTFGNKDSKKTETAPKKVSISEQLQRDAHGSGTNTQSVYQPFSYSMILGQKRQAPPDLIRTFSQEEGNLPKSIFNQSRKSSQQELKYFKSRNPTLIQDGNQNFSPNIRGSTAQSFYQPQNQYPIMNKRTAKEVFDKGYSTIYRSGSNSFVERPASFVQKKRAMTYYQDSNQNELRKSNSIFSSHSRRDINPLY